MRDDIVEDVRFGREMMARSSGGGAVVNADGASALKCRMYENFGEVWQGFSKNIWPAFAGNRVLFYLTGFVFFALLVLPFFALPFSCGVTFKLVLAEIVLILTIRLVISLRFKTSIVGAILHLPAMLVSFCALSF